ncbi:VOC family protein [Marinifaba aquimaris]|uniref:VOC family protein n=1 Tax=Marinifaba aquimaris TaxID=2741323 RepID=UPI001C2D6B14|nr:VOC family protein [Marinifaba aquimaris]
MREHEKLNYVEYAAFDLTQTKRFFTQVFNWQFTDYGPDYCDFTEQGIDGGFYRADKKSVQAQGGALLVFYSNDLVQTRNKIVKAGGEVTQDIFDFPGGQRFHFTEPSGNEFAVWSDNKVDN